MKIIQVGNGLGVMLIEVNGSNIGLAGAEQLDLKLNDLLTNELTVNELYWHLSPNKQLMNGYVVGGKIISLWQLDYTTGFLARQLSLIQDYQKDSVILVIPERFSNISLMN